MPLKRPYPETYLPIHHRVPRVATRHNWRVVVMPEPGFETVDRVRLHDILAVDACEGLGDDALELVGPDGAVFEVPADTPLVAGMWCDAAGRLIVAWSDAQQIYVYRTVATDLAAMRSVHAWEALQTPLPFGEQWHLGSGAMGPAGLVLSAIDMASGRITVMTVGPEASAIEVQCDLLNHSPSIALDAHGLCAHVVWDTEDLDVYYRRIDLAERRCDGEPVRIWIGVHDPDIAVSGNQVLVTYTDHMHNIKYGYFDGSQWQLDKHLTTLHSRFAETLEHSPWFWTDANGVVRLRFVCLTRRMTYESIWLGDGFSDPQPVETLMHPSLFIDETRVKAERMSVERSTGRMVLSSSFCPEHHGVYAADALPTPWRIDEPILFLDMAELSEARGVTAQLEPMQLDPPTPVLLPTGRHEDFDSARVLSGGTVLFDDLLDRWRMWYGAVALNPEPASAWYDQVYVGYAESNDGVAWQRTDTGGGMTFHGKPAPYRVGNIHHNACVFIDPLDTPDRRYKSIKFENRAMRYDHVHAKRERGYLGRPRRAWLGVSADGKRWQLESATVDFPGPEPYGLQPQGALCDPHDPDPARRYKIIGFSSLVGRRRGVALAYSTDAKHWIAAPRSPQIDSLMAVNPIRGAGPFGQTHDASITRHGRYLLAFYQHQFDGQTADIRLAFSRDNQRFKFAFPETPLVALGDTGAWYSHYLMTGGFVARGDMMAYYFGGSAPRDAKCNEMDIGDMGAGRAVARRDRFVRLAPRDGVASIRTIPLHVEADKPVTLCANARLTSDASLRFALVCDGQPVEGYTLNDCAPLCCDGLDIPVRWGDRTILPITDGPIVVVCKMRGGPNDGLFALTLRKSS